MEKIGVYKITNLINGNLYIGASKNLTSRMAEHKSRYKHKNRTDYNSHLNRAFRKYGIENFKFEIIEQTSLENLYEKEKYWIFYYEAYTKKENYNLTPGGEGNPECDVKGEKNPRALLTEQDVLFCRECYIKNLRPKEIWEKYFSNKITYNGFRNMYRGRTWKHIKPEVFKKQPQRTLTKQEVLECRMKKKQSFDMKEVWLQNFSDRIQLNSFKDMWNNKTWKNL